MSPRLSCILATGNRLLFARQAIRCFLRQTYDDSELIVIDDGAERIGSLCAGLLRVRYLRLDEPTPLGRKLNLGVEQARGSIIQKLDDDDYYHPEFLERAVAALPPDPSHRPLVAWDCFMVFFAGDAHVRFSRHGWTAGGTLCFHRALWERAAFRQVPRHVDTYFIADTAPRIVKVCAPQHYILVRHGANTWNHMSDGGTVDGYFRRLPAHAPIASLVEPIDRPFYESLARQGATCGSA
jgi:glycosyltransferase involved in cell wall biosynthesis